MILEKGLIVEFTPFKALSRPVVSPPISTVIPFILLATLPPPFLKMGMKKDIYFSVNVLVIYFIQLDKLGFRNFSS